MSKNKVPPVEGLFTWPSDQPKLIASRCKKCGALAFPKAPYCTNPDCEKEPENVEVIELSNIAKLYTWAVQAYPPPLPFKLEPFEPFPIGMLPVIHAVDGLYFRIKSVQFCYQVGFTHSNSNDLECRISASSELSLDVVY